MSSNDDKDPDSAPPKADSDGAASLTTTPEPPSDTAKPEADRRPPVPERASRAPTPVHPGGETQRGPEGATALARRADLALLDAALKRYAGKDWETDLSQAPQQAQADWVRFLQLRDARNELARDLEGQEARERMAASRARADAMAETGRVLARDIPDWSADTAQKLVSYAAEFGVTLEELHEMADPRLWKVLHRAHSGDELKRQQEAVRANEQAQQTQPATTVSGLGAHAQAPGVRDELGMAEWMRRRNEQTRRRY